MPWPQNPTTLPRPSSSDPVSAALLALILDAIEGRKHADVPLIISPWMLQGTGVLRSATPVAARLQATGDLGLVVNQGDRFTSLTYARKGNGVADLVVSLYVTTPAGVDTVLIPSTSDNNPGAAFADNTINFADTIIAAGSCLSLSFFATVADIINIGSIRFNRDRP